MASTVRSSWVGPRPPEVTTRSCPATSSPSPRAIGSRPSPTVIERSTENPCSSRLRARCEALRSEITPRRSSLPVSRIAAVGRAVLSVKPVRGRCGRRGSGFRRPHQGQRGCLAVNRHREAARSTHAHVHGRLGLEGDRRVHRRIDGIAGQVGAVRGHHRVAARRRRGDRHPAALDAVRVTVNCLCSLVRSLVSAFLVVLGSVVSPLPVLEVVWVFGSRSAAARGWTAASAPPEKSPT